MTADPPDVEEDIEDNAAVADGVRTAWRSALGADGSPAAEVDPTVGFMAGGGHSLHGGHGPAQYMSRPGSPRLKRRNHQRRPQPCAGGRNHRPSRNHPVTISSAFTRTKDFTVRYIWLSI